MKLHVAFALSLIASLSACKKKNNEATAPAGSAAGSAAMAPVPTPEPGSAAMAGSAAEGSAAMAGSAAAPAAPALTDPQIAAIVVAANQVDIDAGKLALKKSKNAEVKKFAQQMVTDHEAVNKAAVALVTKLKVTPEETDASKGLTAGGAENRAKLEKLSGADFDKAYVDNEVEYHKAVINVVDTQLIPSASNADLKNTLISVKPTLDAHLQHAESVQAALAGGGSAAASGHNH